MRREFVIGSDSRVFQMVDLECCAMKDVVSQPVIVWNGIRASNKLWDIDFASSWTGIYLGF